MVRRKKYDVDEGDLRKAIKAGFAEEAVLWIEPVAGLPVGQPDCALWIPFKEGGTKWVQVELKCSPRPWSHLSAHGYYGSKSAALLAERKGSEVWGLLRETQRRRAKRCFRSGIPFWVFVLRPEHQFHEVDVFVMIKSAPDRRDDANFLHVGCVDLADVTPEALGLLMERE